jgi:hypothetical protein
MQSHLERRLDLLRETNRFPPGLIDRFGKWAVSAPEEKLYRINPLRWAKDVGADENLVIDLFLYATHAGIVDMVWSVLCTNCGILVNSQGGLRAMSKGKRHCRL